MNEDYSWLYNELQNVKTFVLKNKMLYPTYQNKDTVLNINLWIDSKTDNYMSDLCPGYCLKEKDKLTDWKYNQNFPTDTIISREVFYPPSSPKKQKRLHVWLLNMDTPCLVLSFSLTNKAMCNLYIPKKNPTFANQYKKR